MTTPQPTGWQAIQAEVLRRVHAREWPPGHIIPGEVDLAAEFGCARATVNRALQALADAGILERRRKAGTRVAIYPVGRAVLDIPVLRQDIEERGHVYGYRLLEQSIMTPDPVCAQKLGGNTTALHVRAVHLADDAPFVLEDRWINLKTVPHAAEQSFDTLSANEWLLHTVPYTKIDVSLSAQAASEEGADTLRLAPGAPVFTVERTTWDHDDPVTYVTLRYAPGFELHTQIGG